MNMISKFYIKYNFYILSSNYKKFPDTSYFESGKGFEYMLNGGFIIQYEQEAILFNKDLTQGGVYFIN